MVGERIQHRIPDNWRWIITTRAAVALVMLVAMLSVITGIIHIDQRAADFGPVAGYVPDSVQESVGFTGALTGFMMVASALALRRGLRAGWWTTMILLPATAVQGLLQAHAYSMPLIVLSIISLPTLLLTKRRFDKPIQLSVTQMAAGGALVGVQAYGTFGAFALREDFDHISTPVDAFYFTLVTSSTVGYGDITPQTAEAQLFTMSVVVLGVASFGVAIGALVGPALQARISKTLGKMTDSQLEHLEDHILVLGYGELTEPIVDELQIADQPFVVVTRRDDGADTLIDRDIPVVRGNPSDEAPLIRAKVEQAAAVVAATNHDAEDALAVLTARELASDVRIVASATDRENKPKLERAGADAVISPAVLGGSLLARSALGSDDSDVLEQILRD